MVIDALAIVAMTLLLVLQVAGSYIFWRARYVYLTRQTVLNEPGRPIGECVDRWRRLPSFRKMVWLQPFTFYWHVD